MMLVEQTTVPGTTLPVAEFKDHLRLGTGFANDGVQDSVLEGYLRASISAIEARTGKALIERGFTWTLTAWRDLAAQVLPIAPVSAITGLTITDRLGVDDVIDPARYLLEKDTHRPKLVAASLVLPSIPVGGEPPSPSTRALVRPGTRCRPISGRACSFWLRISTRTAARGPAPRRRCPRRWPCW